MIRHALTRGLVMGVAALGAAVSCASAQVMQGDITIELSPVATGLTAPVLVTHAGDNRLFIVDQAGRIRIVENGVLLATPFLDVTPLIVTVNPGFDERGLLGLAFHPNYAANGRFFVRYSRPRTGVAGEPCFGTARGCHEEVLAEFSVSANPNVANPTPTVMLVIPKPQFNHNSGDIVFGPDGFLYMSMGDGGGANDGLSDVPPSHGPIGNGQNIDTLLGKVLRLDVNGAPPYGIPADNPFVGVAGHDEIWAYGLRNPYRFSFDNGPGGNNALYLGDVGQNLKEELDIIVRGGNYGWVIKEGNNCFNPFNPGVPLPACNDAGMIAPIVDYGRTDGISIIGGFVYRGTQFPQLLGKYVFGDFSLSFGAPTGQLYYLDPAANPTTIFEFRLGNENRPLANFVKGFGRDNAGELYLCHGTALAPTGTSGRVSRIVSVPCGSADFDNDGDTGTDADIEAFFTCLGGNCCPICQTADFNHDGDTGTDEDIEAFFRVLGGGAC